MFLTINQSFENNWSHQIRWHKHGGFYVCSGFGLSHICSSGTRGFHNMHAKMTKDTEKLWGTQKIFYSRFNIRNICRNSFDEGPGNMNPWPHTWCPLHHGVQQPQSSFQERATPNFDLLFLLVRLSWRDFALQLGWLDFQAILCPSKVLGESKPCRSLCQGRIQSVITLDQKFVGIKALHRPFNG